MRTPDDTAQTTNPRPKGTDQYVPPQRQKGPSRVTIPEHCDPKAKIVFAEMKRQGVTYDEIEFRAGVLRSTIKAWRTAKKPGLETIEACLGALGWGLVPVPRMQHLPPDLQAALEDLSARFGEHMPLLPQLLATVSRIPILGEFQHPEPQPQEKAA